MASLPHPANLSAVGLTNWRNFSRKETDTNSSNIAPGVGLVAYAGNWTIFDVTVYFYAFPAGVNFTIACPKKKTIERELEF